MEEAAPSTTYDPKEEDDASVEESSPSTTQEVDEEAADNAATATPPRVSKTQEVKTPNEHVKGGVFYSTVVSKKKSNKSNKKGVSSKTCTVNVHKPSTNSHRLPGLWRPQQHTNLRRKCLLRGQCRVWHLAPTYTSTHPSPPAPCAIVDST